MSENFNRLVRLADEIFSVKSDPSQLNVDQQVIEKLYKIHPNTVSEHIEGDGPVSWFLVIPTTELLMNRFINGGISEKELYDLTPLNTDYEALYLCSAIVLEEYRRQGIIRRLAKDAINKIRHDHPIKSFFVWPFTDEGDQAAEAIAAEFGLPLYKRT